MKKKLLLSLPYFRQNEKKIFQKNIEKNGPTAGLEMESCLRQCTVCPDAGEVPTEFNFFLILKEFYTDMK